MSDDLLATARELLVHSRFTPATAYAAADAAETLRAVHTCMEAMVQSLDALVSERPATEAQGASCPRCGDNGEYAIGGEPNDPDMEACDCQPTPNAPATPQVGEVWEDTVDGERVRVLRAPDGYDGARCKVVAQGKGEHDKPGDSVTRYIRTDEGWRRVSPAPAPLTEREVTAEAEAQGVEPASDADVDEALDWTRQEVPQYVTPEMAMGLIARVRAEQANAADHEWRADRNAEIITGLNKQRVKAEAQVALMRPVVDEAERATTGWPTVTRGLGCLYEAVRAYREATRDA